MIPVNYHLLDALNERQSKGECNRKLQCWKACFYLAFLITSTNSLSEHQRKHCYIIRHIAVSEIRADVNAAK